VTSPNFHVVCLGLEVGRDLEAVPDSRLVFEREITGVGVAIADVDQTILREADLEGGLGLDLLGSTQTCQTTATPCPVEIKSPDPAVHVEKFSREKQSRR